MAMGIQTIGSELTKHLYERTWTSVSSSRWWAGKGRFGRNDVGEECRQDVA